MLSSVGTNRVLKTNPNLCNMGSNQSNSSSLTGRTLSWVEFEDDWFARGTSRYAYKGTFHGDPRREGKRCVAKIYKEEWYEDMSEYAWKADDRAYLKAHEMVQLFNINYTTTKPIEFVEPEFTQVDTRAAFKFLGFIPFARNVKGNVVGSSDSVSKIISANATIAVERYLEGDYVKFNSNAGYLSDSADMATPAAFSHFTYHESDGEVLVCDLQGVRSRAGFTFTDPAVLSGRTELGTYGPTDLGKFGIVKFFLNHRCNELCKALKKPTITNVTLGERVILDEIVGNMPANRASAYTYQLSELSGISNVEVNTVHSNLTLEPVLPQPVQATD